MLKRLTFEICSVISNKEDAFGLKRAERANITTHFVDPNRFKSREDFDKQLITIIDELDIEPHNSSWLYEDSFI